MRPASAVDVSVALARLAELSTFELRGEWRRHHQVSPPIRLSRDLLLRGIAFAIQVKAEGGHSKATLRRLGQIAAFSDTNSNAPRTSMMLKLGTRLVREWGGSTHSVLVVQTGFEFQGKAYRSLSKIAREITGARWSGPRFFGLVQSRAAQLERGHGDV